MGVDHASMGGGGGVHIVQAVSARENTVFVPGVLEVENPKWISMRG